MTACQKGKRSGTHGGIFCSFTSLSCFGKERGTEEAVDVSIFPKCGVGWCSFLIPESGMLAIATKNHLDSC
jgi:hypothetical protein